MKFCYGPGSKNLFTKKKKKEKKFKNNVGIEQKLLNLVNYSGKPCIFFKN
jgi:hypothetical protein